MKIKVAMEYWSDGVMEWWKRKETRNKDKG